MTPAQIVKATYPDARRVQGDGGFEIVLRDGLVLARSSFPNDAWKAAARKVREDEETCASPPADEIGPGLAEAMRARR